MIPDVAEAVEERLNEAVRRLVEVLRPERIYLFGSRARGDAKEDSDYDLMVFVPRAEGASAERQREGDASLSGVLSPVDLLVWPREVFERQLPVIASFPATIVREGRLLYHDDRPADSMNGDGATPERRNGGPMAAEAEQRRLTQEWIKTAEQDLLVAETVLRHASAPGGVAYHCQQATEKALKGFLLWNEVPFRKTHALKELVEQCET
ncbi:MAG: nucleotidyltransferase domain-containing protein, partial [Dehalococcoidia bacterium]